MPARNDKPIFIRAEARVVGKDYDDLTRAAEAAAVRLLGPDRDHWLSMDYAQPSAETNDGQILAWEATVVITYPTNFGL